MDKSHLITRCFNSSSGPTTVALEPQFWEAFDEILACEGIRLGTLLRKIDRQRYGSVNPHQKQPRISLASAVRTYVLAYFYNARIRPHLSQASDELSSWSSGGL